MRPAPVDAAILEDIGYDIPRASAGIDRRFAARRDSASQAHILEKDA